MERFDRHCMPTYGQQELTKATQNLRVTISRFTQGVDPERMTTPLVIKEHGLFVESV